MKIDFVYIINLNTPNKEINSKIQQVPWPYPLSYYILDATHYLDPSGLKRNFMKKLSWTMLKIWTKRIWYLLIDLSRPVRHPIGLRSGLFQKLGFLLTRKKIIHRDP